MPEPRTPTGAWGHGIMTVHVTTLANGLRVVTDRMDSVETVSIGVWVDVGTRHEPAAINGVAHLLEHMAFKGTERRTRARHRRRDRSGRRPCQRLYLARAHRLLRQGAEGAMSPLAVDILADILQHSVFDEARARARAHGDPAGDRPGEDTPDDIIFDLFQERAFPDQPMGRPVLGRAEIISGARPRRGRELHAGATTPRRGMVLVAAGKVDHDALVALAERAFTTLPRESRRADASPRATSAATSASCATSSRSHLLLGFPGFAFADPDYYAASVLSTAFGGGMSSRLFQEIREKRGLAYSIYSFAHAYSDGGLFGIYAGTGENEAAELMPVLCDEMRRLARRARRRGARSAPAPSSRPGS